MVDAITDNKKPGPGRPKVGSEFVGVRVPPGLMEAVDRFIAEERPGVSRPEALRILAAEHLQHLGMMSIPKK